MSIAWSNECMHWEVRRKGWLLAFLAEGVQKCAVYIQHTLVFLLLSWMLYVCGTTGCLFISFRHLSSFIQETQREEGSFFSIKSYCNCLDAAVIQEDLLLRLRALLTPFITSLFKKDTEKNCETKQRGLSYVYIIHFASLWRRFHRKKKKERKK